MAELNLPPGLGVPAHLQNLFQNVNQPTNPFQHIPANQYGPSVKLIEKGSLVWFNYVNYRHDPYPLLIITDIWPNYIRGLNLHYLTFNYIKNLLGMHCENKMFSYFHIRNDQFLVNAFRTYKRLGIRQIKKLDCNFLKKVMRSIVSFDPAEIEQMRVYVRDQLRRQANPKAEAITEKYIGMQQGNPEQGFAPPQR